MRTPWPTASLSKDDPCRDVLVRSRETDPPSEIPVVLVHGILGQETLYWNIMRRLLRSEQIHAREITLPSMGFGDLREAAVAFRTELHLLLDRLEADKVDIVAHSAGGLVARYYLKRLTTERPIRRLITLGTPHQGTVAARLLPELGMVGQVKPDSDFLRSLNDDDPTPPPTLYTAVWAGLDGIVVPAENARLPPAPNVENIRLRRTTHWGFLVQPRVGRFLVQELKNGWQGGDRDETGGRGPRAERG